MKITKVNEPWPYLIIDDTFPQDVFDELKKEVDKRLAFMDPRQSVEHYELSDVDFHEIPSAKRMLDSYNVRDLIEMFDQKRSLKPASEMIRSCQVSMSRNYVCPVHDESFRKILSSVTYLGPEKSTGTLIYRTETEYVTEIEWKPNRSIVFCGINDVTWHGYKADDEVRITLNQFLYDPDVKPYRPPNQNNVYDVDMLRKMGYDV